MVRLITYAIVGMISQFAVSVICAILPGGWGSDVRFPLHGETWFLDTWSRECACHPMRSSPFQRVRQRGSLDIARCRTSVPAIGDNVLVFSFGAIRVVRLSSATSPISMSYMSTGWPTASLYGYQIKCPCKPGSPVQTGLLDIPTPPLRNAAVISFIMDRTGYAIPYRPLWMGVALNSLLFGGSFYGLGRGALAARTWQRRRSGRCSACGYTLERPGRCPECGQKMT